MFGIKKNCLSNGRRPSLYPHTRRAIKQFVVISLSTTTYNILFKTLLSRLTLYAEEIIEDNQCRFSHNSSTADHIVCFLQILKKKWKYIIVVPQLFIDFKKAYV
jgi:hypothetical protein